MDCATSDGGLRLGGRSGLCRSRSRLRLWQGTHPAASRDGHSRPTNCAAIALAERLCRTPDWLDQAGGTRSRRRAWRASPSARTAILHGISQRGPHASVAVQRRANSTRSSRRRSDLRKASSWWSASPIRSDLIYDRDNRYTANWTAFRCRWLRLPVTKITPSTQPVGGILLLAPDEAVRPSPAC